jgi:coiled-coil domain-containing protein 130
VIRTDPKNADYIIFSGGRKKNEQFDSDQLETPELSDSKDKERIASDAMFRLESNEKDKVKASGYHGGIQGLMELQERNKDDFSVNQLLRRHNRVCTFIHLYPSLACHNIIQHNNDW